MGSPRRRTARPAIVLLAAALSACVSSTELELAPRTGASSALLFLLGVGERGSAPGTLVPVDLTPGAPHRAFSLSGEADVFALYYAETLEELQLGPEPVVLEESTPAPNRAIPAWREVERLRPERRAATDADLQQVDAVLRTVHIPGLDAARCAEHGGCLAEAGAPVCTIPCPGPEAAPVLPDRDPLPPVLELADCPDGQSGLLTGSGLLCATAQTATCAGGQVASNDGVTCRSIGDECPLGQWPDGLGPETTYVAAGARGGDGSELAPYGSVGEAIAHAVSGSTVAVARGRYEETVYLSRGITIVGACAAGTSIVAASGRSSALTVAGAGNGVKNVSLSGGTSAVVQLDAGASLFARGVAIDATGAVGWDGGAGGVTVAEDLVIRRSAGSGAFFGQTSRATLRSVVIDASGGDALRIEGGAVVEASSLRVRGAMGGATDPLGSGITVAGGASLVATDLVVTRTAPSAVRVSDGSTRASITRAIFRDLSRRAGQADEAEGLRASRRASVVVSKLLVERAMDRGVVGEGEATLELRDLVVRDGVASPGATAPAKGMIFDDARVTLERARLERLGTLGIDAVGSSRLDLRELDVAGVALAEEETLGHCVRFRTVSATVAHARLEDCAGRGVVIDTHATATVTVDALTLRRASGGLRLEGDVSLRITRTLVEDVEGFALFATTSDDEVHDAVVVRDLTVRGVKNPTRCGTPTCPEASALEVSTVAHVEVSRFSIADAGAALSAADSAVVTLSDGTVAHNRSAGLRVFAPGLDVLGLIVRVVFEDTGPPIVGP